MSLLERHTFHRLLEFDPRSMRKVTLVGLGTLEARHRKAREGRNPATGKTIQIPATTVPAFFAGKLFKEKVVPAEGTKGQKK